MYKTTMPPFATAVAIVLAMVLTAGVGQAQTPAIQDELDAVLALQRAGSMLVFDKEAVLRVSLSGMKNADRLLDHVKLLSRLERLELAGTAIVDKSLVHLKGLTSLTSLSLYGTRVTDAGMERLKALKKLQVLIVKESKVTLAGAAKLLEAFPKLSIIGVKEWETGTIRVEMKGTLLKTIRDKKDLWSIKIRTSRLGEIVWPLDFLGAAELEKAALRLVNKTVAITGEVVRELHIQGIGGESFLVPPPGPIVVVRTLRPAEE